MKPVYFGLPLIAVLALLLGNGSAAWGGVCYVASPPPGSYRYEALIDIDHDPTTGGSVEVQQSGSQVSIPGIDYIVDVIGYNPGAPTITTAPSASGLKSGPTPLAILGPQVISTGVREWQSTAFQYLTCNNDSYPILPDGIGGSQLVEFKALLSDFNPALPGNATVVFHASQSPFILNDYTIAVPLKGRVTAIPTLEGWGLLALALLLFAGAGWLLARRRAGAGLAALAVLLLLSAGGSLWAASFTMDGQNTDWQGIAPIVTDPANDSGGLAGPNNDAAEDILYGFFASDGTNAYFRMDIRGAIPPVPPV